MTPEQQEQLEQRRCEICRTRWCKFLIHEQGIEMGMEVCNYIDCLRKCKSIFKFIKSQYVTSQYQ